ncbi:MAG: helix-turn-helix domain-containing protein [Candidatus Berkiella sp.]
MNLFGKSLKDVMLNDLELLISEKVKESKIVDYKLLLKLDDDKAKVNMLKDFVAFANAQGGCLIYGIKEVDTYPTEIVGFRLKEYDSLIMQIQSLANTKIEPPIFSLHFKQIPITAKKSVLIIHVPKSWSALHRVNYQTSTFYFRQAGKNQSMDVYQIKQSMLMNQTYDKKIHDFIKERKKLILHENIPVNLKDGPKLLLHVLPIEPFLNNATYDLMHYFNNPLECPPVSNSSVEKFLNIDGVVVTNGNNGQVHSYVQLFRNAVVEAGDTQVFNEQNRTISFEMGDKLMHALACYLNIFARYKISSSLYIAMSMMNAKGYKILLPESYDTVRAIDRDHIMFDSYVHSGSLSEVENALRPLFSLFFNTFGVSKNLYYDAKGHFQTSNK